MDKRIDDAVKKFDATGDPKIRRKVLTELIGEENFKRLMARADQADSFAVDQVFYRINYSYVKGKREKVLAAAGGAAPTK